MLKIEHPPEKRRFLPNLERAEPLIQDSTAYKELINCRRRYFYRIVLGRVPAQGNKYQIVLDFGSAYHKFRELLELEGYGTAMNYALNFKLPEVDPKFKFAYLNQKRLIQTCQVAYEHVIKERAQGKIEVIAVEQPFNVEVAPGIFIGGRADQIIKWNGSIWGRDFKTTSKDAGTFDKGLNPNDQAMRYIVGESAIHGQPIKGIIFEAMYNAKTIQPTLYPKPATRNPSEIQQWLNELIFNHKMLEDMRAADIWPMDTHNCSWCPYHDVCKLGNQSSMENKLRQDFRFSPWDYNNVEQGDTSE